MSIFKQSIIGFNFFLLSLKKVGGVAKLQKKVRQEIRFLERFLETEARLKELKKEHIQCSNLVHLHSIITQAQC